MNIILDMNLSPRWAVLLNEVGFYAKHWSEVGEPTAADEVIMAYARKTDAVVITQDLDFSAILAATQGNKPSVIQLRSGTTPSAETLDYISKALRLMHAELQLGALVTIDSAKARIRLLPL
jgi:predicted nuclease of predicted toxin-antitoxin system